MSLVNDLRGVVDSLQAIPASLGARLFAVTVRVEQLTGDLQDGESVSGVAQPDLVLSPAPIVERVQLADPSWFAAGSVLPDTGADPKLAIYRVRSITPAYTSGAGGGYSQAQLAPKPTFGTNQRVVYLLAGPGLNAGGEKFKLLDAEFSGLFNWSLVLIRAPEFDT